MKKIITLVIGLVIFSANLVSAANLVNSQPPLTKDDIQHFMKAMKPLQDLGEKYDFEEDDEPPTEHLDPLTFSPMTRSLDNVITHEAFPEFELIVQDAGFVSAQKWASVGDRVMRAYLALRMIAEMTPEKKLEIQKSLAEIENNAYLSPETKKLILSRLRLTLDPATHMPANAKADQEILKPFMEELERLFEE